MITGTPTEFGATVAGVDDVVVPVPPPVGITMPGLFVVDVFVKPLLPLEQPTNMALIATRAAIFVVIFCGFITNSLEVPTSQPITIARAMPRQRHNLNR